MDCADFLVKRFADLARREGHTRFLEPGESVRLACVAAREAGVQVAFDGGYPGAERTIAVFYACDEPEAEERITCLRVEWNPKYASVGHRDLLGASMGLGVEREMVGDILVEEACAHVFVLADIAEYVRANLESAGRAKLRVSVETGEFDPPEPEGESFRETVGAPRLDAVVAAGYALSRDAAQKLVKQGLVKLNHVPCERADARLNAGDLLSVRGYGRLRLTEILGETKKGRVALQFFRYGR